MVLVDPLDCLGLPYAIDLVRGFCLGTVLGHEPKAMIARHRRGSSVVIHCDALQLGPSPSVTQEVLLPKVCHLRVMPVAATAAAYPSAHV